MTSVFPSVCVFVYILGNEMVLEKGLKFSIVEKKMPEATYSPRTFFTVIQVFFSFFGLLSCPDQL